MKKIYHKIMQGVGTLILRLGVWLEYKVSYDLERLGAKIIDRF